MSVYSFRPSIAEMVHLQYVGQDEMIDFAASHQVLHDLL